VLSPANSLYVLDLNNFNWYIPKVSGELPPTSSAFGSFERAVVIGKYMVVSFGKYMCMMNDNFLK